MKKGALRKWVFLPKEADRFLHYTVVILGLFGVVMQVSASMSSSMTSLSPLIWISFKQVFYFVVSYIFMIICANYFSFAFIRKHIDKIVILTGLFLIIALAFPEVGGSNAWIKLSFMGKEVSIQPSEFAKLSMVIIMAVYLGDIKRHDLNFRKVIMRPLLIFLAYFFIITVLQRDIGTAIIMTLITAVCFLIPANGALRRYQLLCVLLLLVFAFLLMWFMTDDGLAFLENISALQYQIVRFKAARNPFSNRYGSGFYDLVNSLIAFNTGGWSGVGLGKSLRKYGYISAASTDFIMAVIVEELGIWGFICVLVGYTIIIGKMFGYALKVYDEKSKIVIIGMAMYFFVHFVFNIGGVTCLIPLTGIPLLLISSGGSSSLASMMAVGIVQAVIVRYRRQKARLEEERECA